MTRTDRDNALNLLTQRWLGTNHITLPAVRDADDLVILRAAEVALSQLLAELPDTYPDYHEALQALHTQYHADVGALDLPHVDWNALSEVEELALHAQHDRLRNEYAANVRLINERHAEALRAIESAIEEVLQPIAHLLMLEDPLNPVDTLTDTLAYRNAMLAARGVMVGDPPHHVTIIPGFEPNPGRLLDEIWGQHGWMPVTDTRLALVERILDVLGVVPENPIRDTARHMTEWLEVQDPLIGLQKDTSDMLLSIDSARQYAQHHHEPAALVSFDLANLRALHYALNGGTLDRGAGQIPRAFRLYRLIARMVEAAFEEVYQEYGDPGRFEMYHHGGDEFALICTGLQPDQIQEALALAQERIATFVQEAGLYDLPHSKYPDIRQKDGTGVYSGVVMLDERSSKLTPQALQTMADNAADAQKNQAEAGPLPEPYNPDRITLYNKIRTVLGLDEGTSVPHRLETASRAQNDEIALFVQEHYDPVFARYCQDYGVTVDGALQERRTTNPLLRFEESVQGTEKHEMYGRLADRLMRSLMDERRIDPETGQETGGEEPKELSPLLRTPELFLATFVQQLVFHCFRESAELGTDPYDMFDHQMQRLALVQEEAAEHGMEAFVFAFELNNMAGVNNLTGGPAETKKKLWNPACQHMQVLLQDLTGPVDGSFYTYSLAENGGMIVGTIMLPSEMRQNLDDTMARFVNDINVLVSTPAKGEASKVELSRPLRGNMVADALSIFTRWTGLGPKPVVEHDRLGLDEASNLRNAGRGGQMGTSISVATIPVDALIEAGVTLSVRDIINGLSERLQQTADRGANYVSMDGEQLACPPNGKGGLTPSTPPEISASGGIGA